MFPIHFINNKICSNQSVWKIKRWFLCSLIQTRNTGVSFHSIYNFFFHNKVCICRQVYKFRFLVFFLMYKIVLYKFWLNYRTCRCALIQLHVKTVGQNYFFPFMIRFYYLSKCTPLKKRPSCMRRSRGGRDVRTFWIIHTLNLPNPFHPANKIIPA